MNNNELFYFTGRCLTLDDVPGFRKVIIEKITTDAIDWEKFVTLCSNHLIVPSIYLKFQTHDILRYLPDELSEYFKEISDLNVVRNSQILLQLEEIISKLNSHNIYPIFLKGSGNLLDQLYQDKGERILGDIDFLVPKKDYLLAAKLLEEEGYSIFAPIDEEIEKMKHYPRISKPGYPAILEIHQLPVKKRCQSWFNSEMIEKDKKPLASFPGSYVLSDNHNIILNFIHSQLDHEGHLYGIVSFRDLYDLYLLSKRTPLTQTINNIKTRKMAIAYFAFARKVFGLNELFFPETNFTARLFAKKHDLNHGSVFFYHSYRSIIYLIKHTIKGPFGQIIQSFYSKEMRQSIYNRLTNPKWYPAHLHYYSNLFFRTKK
jgi:hypothetical protein